MLNAFKARLRASVCLIPSAADVRKNFRTGLLAIFRLVQPATFAARRLGCDCIGRNQLLNNCPYHGLEARRVIHG